MAERVDAVAVNLGDRPGCAELEIAGHERDADGRPDAAADCD
jgi:hypothetical protein